jgi:hypothetical protein
VATKTHALKGNPNAVVLRGEIFEKWLGREGSVLVKYINVVILEVLLLWQWVCYKSEFGPLLLASAFALSHDVLSCLSVVNYEMTRHEGPGQMQLSNLGLPGVQSCKPNKFLLKNDPVSGILLQHSWKD